MKAVIRPLLLVLTVALLSIVAISQDMSYMLRVDVGLVELSASVLDRRLRMVTSLKQDQFEIFEDGVAQQLALFKREDAPLSLGLVIDNSGSMRNKRERVNRAALAFIRESNPEDETFIVNFNAETHLDQDFTSRIDDLAAALSGLRTGGDTALYDAVHFSADHLQKGKRDRKALLLITDGEDTISAYSFRKTLDALRKSNVTLYAIGLLEQENGRRRSRRNTESRQGEEVLEEFAAITGGQAYFPESVNEVQELCKRIARDLRNQYTLGYFSSNKALDGSWRKVTVNLKAKNASQMTVKTRPGYYAPRMDSGGEIQRRDQSRIVRDKAPDVTSTGQ